MSLKDNRGPTLDIVEAIRQSVRRRSALRLDFTTLRQISPGAALVLAAELDRWRRLLNFRPVVFDADQWDATVLRRLDETGLFDLVEAQNPPTLRFEAAPSESFIRYRSGRRTLGDEAVALREAIEAVLGHAMPTRREMYRGITEAMTNVTKHAYLGPFRTGSGTPFLPGAWWIGGGYDIANRRLRTLVYDQGVGIPATLPRRYPIEILRRVIQGHGWQDGDASRIAAAMELGATRTLKPNQGRGLPDLRRLVDAADNATLRILSLKGEYIYASGKSEQLADHPQPLNGTLIQWEIDL